MRVGTGKIDVSCGAYKSVVSTNRVEADSLNALIFPRASSLIARAMKYEYTKVFNSSLH